MKKSYLMLAAAAALFAACSSNDLAEEKSPQTTQQTTEQAVGFDAYVNRGTTRGGYEGSLTATSIQDATAGFGVFGYYTNNVLYGQTAIPDFFYNQKVTNSSGWTYSPIKYWPNEYGTGAESTGQDKLTFFAYAPYVEVNSGSGRMANKADEQYGIVGMTSNNTSGDPYVKYIASFDPEKRVDLCYGVANSDFKSSVDGNNNNVLQGKPYIDVIKPKIGDKIHFNFKHALASLNVTIDADIDEVSHGSTDYLPTNATKIYVRKVTFEGFADKGSLNLNSEAITDEYTPNWFELNSINRRLSSGTVTIYDGRRDGREGQANATASNETPNNLKSSIIEDEGATTAGVPVTPVNLFDSETADAPIFVIPTEEDLKVTIVYDVETVDNNLSTYLSDGKTKGSSVENTITKTITYNGGTALKLQAGKAYKVSLHLGMTSVKFDATVTEWPTPVTEADNTDLPINSPASFSPTALDAQTAATHDDLAVAVKDPSNADVNMSTGYTFATTYSDNNGHSDVAIDLSATGTTTGFTVDLPALTDFYGRVYKVVITKTASGEKQTVNITQNAPVITMTTPTASGAVVTLAAPTVSPTIAWDWAGTEVEVYDNTDAPVASGWTWDSSAHTVTFAAPATTGNYKFILKKDESKTAMSDAVNVTIP